MVMPTNNNGMPNILWICSDMLRHDAIGALGNRHIKTPNIDSLCSSGVAFTRAYCQNPVCTPSRASFLTGRYPFATGVMINGNDYFPDDEQLITKTLADRGYDCGLVGKLHLAAAFSREALPNGESQGVTRVEPRARDGYRVFHWNHDPKNIWTAVDEYHPWIAEQGVDLGLLRKSGKIPERLHQSVWCADQAIHFMEEEAHSPWLLSVNFFHPHTPFDVSKERIDRFDIDSLPGPLFRESDLAMQNGYLHDVDFLARPAAMRPGQFTARILDGHQSGLSELSGHPGKLIQAAYWACVELVDQEIGRIIDSLQSLGQRENTIVVFHADHGEPYGDHGLYSAGCRFYEGVTRVPLVFSWPGRFREGLQAEGLVELIDLVPTLHHLLGLPIAPKTHGQSLLDVLTGDAEPERFKPGVRCEYYFTCDDFSGRLNGTYGTMYRDERYKVCVFHGLAIGELYDLQEDPGEFDNLWDSPTHADIKHRLIKESFDRCMLTIDRGPERTGHA